MYRWIRRIFVLLLLLFTAMSLWIVKVAQLPANSLKTMQGHLPYTVLMVLPSSSRPLGGAAGSS